MTPEINEQNKQRFFALYWGQWIMVRYNRNGASGIGESTMRNVRNSYLLLTPLSMISDEDIDVLSWGENRILTKRQVFEVSISHSYHIKEIDFLRSRGYALPWMGLSVEKLVQSGWVKLKTKP